MVNPFAYIDNRIDGALAGVLLKGKVAGLREVMRIIGSRLSVIDKSRTESYMRILRELGEDD